MTHEKGETTKNENTKTQDKTSDYSYSATKKTGKNTKQRPDTKSNDRFCEQARKGEAIVAQGKVEHVTDTRTEREYYRVILGNVPSDYMVLSRV
jgi:predicted nucleotidyltransferase